MRHREKERKRGNLQPSTTSLLPVRTDVHEGVVDGHHRRLGVGRGGAADQAANAAEAIDTDADRHF